MGRRGPQSKTPKAKKLAGNPGKRRISPEVAAAPAEIPAGPAISLELRAPDWLPPAAREEWDRILPLVARRLDVAGIDLQALVSYCVACAEVQSATQTLEDEGRYFHTEKGDIRRHPAVMVQSAAMGRVRQYLLEFGLSPNARQRLPQKPDKPEADPIGELIGERE